MRESCVQFGSDSSLVGVLTEPGVRRDTQPAVLFLNAGMIHRVGSNRLYVTLARRLAARGHASLRFDLSGIGDSPPARDTRSVEVRRIEETRAAMQTVQEATGADCFLLFGHCSGALVSFLAAREDPRVVGLGLLNPPGKLLLRHFLRTFLRHPAAWRRLFVGEATVTRQLRRFLREGRVRGEPKRGGDAPMYDVLGSLRAFAERGTDVLLVYSEWDTGLDYFRHALRGPLETPELRERIRAAVVHGADHNFNLLAHQERVLAIVDDWVESRDGARAAKEGVLATRSG